MKSKSIKYLNLILALFLLLFAVGYTYAWFSDDKQRNLDFEIETSGYFAGGTGAENDPFTIVSPVHLYNLAWLQDTGRLTQSYHFSVSNDIDMGNTVLPPIGNDTHPFIGSFNGNGHKISNLTVSTNKAVLTNLPSQDVTFSNYVGMFGRTGITPATESASGTQATVKNFLLDNPLIEVSSAGAYSADESLPESGVSTTAAGLAVGYAYGTVSNVAVYQGRLKVDKENYQTVNSIIGALHSTVDGSDIGVTPEDGNAGNDVGYLLPRDFYNMVNKTDNTSIALNGGTYTLITSDYGYDAGYNSLERWNETIEANTTQSTHGLGIFAVTANGNSGIRLRAQQTISRFNYYEYNSDTSTPLPESTLVSYDTKDASGKSWNGLLTELNGDEYNETSLVETFRYNGAATAIGNNDIVITNEKEYNINNSNHPTIKNATALTTNTLWFNIIDSTNAYLFFVGVGSSTSLRIDKAMDADKLSTKMKTKATNELATAGGLLQDEITALVANVDNSDFFFKNDYDILTDDIAINANSICYNVAIPPRSSQTGTGFKFDLSSFGAGLYSISIASGSNSDIHYIKASGVAGESGSGGGSGTEEKAAITNVDFVNTLTMEYNSTDDTFVDFTKLETKIFFGTNSVVILWFERNTVDSTRITVEYNGGAPVASNSALADFNQVTKTIQITTSGIVEG